MIISDLASLIQAVGYFGIFAIVFAETGLLIGLFLPGDSLLFTAGLLASEGTLDLRVLLAVCFVAAVAGDSVGYALGVRYGRRLFERESGRFFQRGHLLRTEEFFARHGGRAVVLARFLPVLRTMTPVVAGIGAMRYRRFLAFNVLGGLLWAVGVTLAGYALGSAIPGASQYLLPLVLLIVAASSLPAAVHLWREHAEEVSRSIRRRAVYRLVAAALLLALLTTLGLVVRTGASSSLDELIASPIRGLGTTPLGVLFATLDRLGSVPVWTTLVVLTAVLAWRVGRRGPALFLLAGLTAEIATALVKAVVDRPRPLDHVTDLVATASFPSGHVVRTVVALGLVVALVVPRRRRSGAVVAAMLFLLAMGLARVASGEHWPSDVLGGYLLGGAALSLLLAVAAIFDANYEDANYERISPDPTTNAPVRVRSAPRAPARAPGPWKLSWWTLFGLVTFTLILASVRLVTDLPGVADAEIRVGSLVTQHASADSRVVPPRTFTQSLVAVEDERFYQHPGVDLIAAARVAWGARPGGTSQEAGATLAQQLAKLLYIEGDDNTLAKKVHMAVLALQLEQRYSKQEILEMYANAVYFGGGYWGIDAASHGYFGKPAVQLDWAEASMLAGLPRAPSTYAPSANFDLARQRQKTVLAALVRNNFLTQAEADSAYTELTALGR